VVDAKYTKTKEICIWHECIYLLLKQRNWKIFANYCIVWYIRLKQILH